MPGARGHREPGPIGGNITKIVRTGKNGIRKIHRKPNRYRNRRGR